MFAKKANNISKKINILENKMIFNYWTFRQNQLPLHEILISNKEKMKKIVLLLSLLLVFSCNSSNNKSYTEKQVDELKAAIENAEASDVVETKLFLDFQFGMTENEVKKHVGQLEKDGKFGLDYRNKYAYSFTTKSGIKCKIYAAPSYYEGKLYQMTYIVESVLGESTNFDMKETFAESERASGFKNFTKKNVFDENEYYFVKDNLIITFKKGYGDSRMIYENAPISKLAKEESKRQKSEKSQKSASEF